MKKEQYENHKKTFLEIRDFYRIMKISHLQRHFISL